MYRDILACNRDNKHQVPANAIKAQLKRFEPTPKGLEKRVVIIGELPNRYVKFFRWLLELFELLEFIFQDQLRL